MPSHMQRSSKASFIYGRSVGLEGNNPSPPQEAQVDSLFLVPLTWYQFLTVWLHSSLFKGQNYLKNISMYDYVFRNAIKLA